MLLLIATFLHMITGAPYPHARAAYLASTLEIPARQLLAQSWKESRWQAPGRFAVSRMEGGRRRTGFLRTFAGTEGPYFCGALQVKRLTPAACAAINGNLRASYAEAVAHLQAWKDYCIRQGRAWRVCALSGYAGGVKGTRMNGRARKYAEWILRQASTHARAAT